MIMIRLLSARLSQPSKKEFKLIKSPLRSQISGDKLFLIELLDYTVVHKVHKKCKTCLVGKFRFYHVVNV